MSLFSGHLGRVTRNSGMLVLVFLFFNKEIWLGLKHNACNSDMSSSWSKSVGNPLSTTFNCLLWAISKVWEAAVAEWYRYRTVACFVTGSSPVPLKTRRVGQRCTLNLSRAETSSRWCGVVVRRGGASSGVVHVT
ncbi:uncharacterized protein TNCV_3347151 [Trichonephila clavipes]|nr:uncharacterized protein TNCV_3347151 [Trichonephila clavipes]